MLEQQTSLVKRLGLVGGILLFGLVLAAPTPEGMTAEGQKTAAVTVLMAIWWMTECVPIPATALLPLALFPMLGVMSMTKVSMCFADKNIMLFTGGFFIAMAMQKWNLHKRLALHVVRAIGTNPRRMVLGFMVATALLSMWISNTATCMMMLPIAISVITQFEETAGAVRARGFAVALMLGIAYASSIGGIGTLIGTPPNLVLVAQMGELFPDAPEIGFLQWMLVGVPLTLVFLPITWVLLTRVFFRLPTDLEGETPLAVDDELARLGRMSRGEWSVLVVFVLTALGWMFRKDLDLDFVLVPGWGGLFPHPDYLHDGTVAMFFAIVLFVLPVDFKKGEFALDWRTALGIPWGILLLFGGGLAIASGFEKTGLVEWVGAQLDVLSGMPPVVVILGIAVLMTFLTEVTSNTATTTVMLPVLAGTASGVLQVNPLLLMIPATISASCAFMLPVATPPNAIVFGSRRLTIAQMARTGLVLNLIGVVLVTLVTYLIAVPVFGLGV